LPNHKDAQGQHADLRPDQAEPDRACLIGHSIL
jgi:hypothetical protein